jgi:DHA1 family tetracycline resistance protein-like MFS transporter
VGFGIVIPILPLYGERFGPSGLTLGLLMASYSAMQFIAAPILGRISDRVGRRPVLLVSLVGSVIGYLLFGFAGSMVVLFAARIIDGISGGNIATAQAVIADITGPEERAKGMGIIGAAFGLGFILGPAISALLVDIKPWLPGVAAAVTSALAFVLVLAKLPETLPEDARREAKRHPLNLDSLREVLGAHPVVGLCFGAVLLIIFAFANFETTFAQFATAVHGFEMSQIGWLFVYAGVLGAIVQGGLVGRLVRRFGEQRLLVSGTVIAALAVGAVPYPAGIGGLLAVLALFALGQGLVSPSLSSLTSKLVHPDEVGGVMGIYQAFSSLARIGGPVAAELAFEQGPAWPFRLAAVVYLGAFGVVVALVRRLQTTPESAR